MMKVGGMDVESVSLDIQDPENRVLSIAVYGDLHPNGVVFIFTDEGDTLVQFLTEIQGYTALLGWNSDAFDSPLLYTRLKTLGVDMDAIGMPIILDCMRVHQFMLRKGETSYTLDHVAKKHLNEGKLPFDPSQTLETFQSDKAALARYNLQDARLVYLLNRNFGYWDTFDAIVTRSGLDEYNTRKFAGLSQKEDGGFAWWRPLMGLVTEFCKRENRPVPQWPTDNEKRVRSQERVDRPGGFVEAPMPGHHKNVIEFDFKSLYPTIIQTFNLGFDTEFPDGDIVSPCSRFRSQPRSVVASILDELVEERSAVKREYEKRKSEGANEEELAALKGKIEALKVFNNSFYGQFYSSFSPLYNYNSAKTITLVGQECVKTMLEKMRELGLTVIAGDTDSTYVKVPDEMFNKEAALRFSQELTTHISMHLKKRYDVNFVGSFDFKSLLSDMAIWKKKFYARLEVGKMVKDIELKGYVRGNTPYIQRETQRKVFETMFEGRDVKLMLDQEKEHFLMKKDHTGFISWMRPHTSRGNTAQVRAKRAFESLGVIIQKFEAVGFLLVGKGKRQWRLAAHMLPDSRIEWLKETENTLRQETEFLSREEAETMWDRMTKKLDGVN